MVVDHFVCLYLVYILILNFLCTQELVKKFVWWVVCKPILVFYFGPNLVVGLGLRLGPSRTIPQKQANQIQHAAELKIISAPITTTGWVEV